MSFLALEFSGFPVMIPDLPPEIFKTKVRTWACKSSALKKQYKSRLSLLSHYVIIKTKIRMLVGLHSFRFITH